MSIMKPILTGYINLHIFLLLSKFLFTKLPFPLSCWVSTLKFHTLWFKFSHVVSWKWGNVSVPASTPFLLERWWIENCDWNFSRLLLLLLSIRFSLLLKCCHFYHATKLNVVELYIYRIRLHRKKWADRDVVFQLEWNIFLSSPCISELQQDTTKGYIMRM